MKNKNGFIATGLIYSFFLIFLTLFLTVITNHIKNKVSLSYVEEEIKDSLNSHKTVRDFELGDLISFVNDCNLVGNDTFENNIDNSYVVANIVTNESNELSPKICSDDNTECLILYSYKLYDSKPENSLTYDNLKIDISTGYLNNTYINKIVYNFDKSNSNSYNLKEGLYAEVNSSNNCIEDFQIFCNEYGKIIDVGNVYYRKREVKSFTNNRVERCKVEDAMGVIYVKE